MKVILIEFNELSPSLMDEFIASGKLPNFAKLRSESEVFVTDAEETEPYLEPWIQWVTVHSGLRYGDHKVTNLGDGYQCESPRIWDIASEAGLRVWVCGSMNAYCRDNLNGFFLPDPWACTVKPQPDWLAPYFRFVQANVQEHTQERPRLSAKDYARFLGFMTTHGLSAETVASAVRQSSSEQGGRNRWKRAALLDRFQFDLFRHIHGRLRPDLATFFANSTAYMQHRFWRQMKPEAFRIQPSNEEKAEFGSAILYGYQQMDRLVGKFLELAGDDTALILCTALSQQPCLTYEEQGGKILYRPRDLAQLIRFASITALCSIEPVMAEQFYLRFESEHAAQGAVQWLSGLRVDERQAMAVEQRGNDVFIGCRITTPLPEDAVLRNSSDGQSVPFSQMFYRVPHSLKSGMHHPDGIFWISRPGVPAAVRSEKVSLTAVAPTILRLLGLRAPNEMEGIPLAAAA